MMGAAEQTSEQLRHPKRQEVHAPRTNGEAR